MFAARCLYYQKRDDWISVSSFFMRGIFVKIIQISNMCKSHAYIWLDLKRRYNGNVLSANINK